MIKTKIICGQRGCESIVDAVPEDNKCPVCRNPLTDSSRFEPVETLDMDATGIEDVPHD